MPLIVRGARQVGKTYLVETFGRQRFESVLTVNLEQKDVPAHCGQRWSCWN